MKRLSFLLLGLVLLVGFMSCNKTNTAQLAATLNAPDGTLAVLRDLATEGGDAVDTAKVEAGKIVYTKMHPAGLYGVEVGTEFYPVLLGEKPFSFDASKPEVPTHYEGEGAELFNKYAELSFNLEKELFPLKDQLKALEDAEPSDETEAKMEELEGQIDKSLGDFETNSYQLLKQYPDNLYAIHLALQMGLRDERLHDLAAWLDTWKNDYSGSLTMQSMRDYIAREKKLERNQPFLDFTATDINGDTVKFSDIAGKGKPVLLKLWASWCRPCRMSMPHTIELYNKYKDKGLEIVCVSVDENLDAWKKAMKDDGLTWSTNYIYPDMMSPESPMVIYNTVGIPFTVLFDKAGKIVDRNLSPEDLEKRLDMIFSVPEGAEIQWDSL